MNWIQDEVRRVGTHISCTQSRHGRRLPLQRLLFLDPPYPDGCQLACRGACHEVAPKRAGQAKPPKVAITSNNA